MVTFVVTILPLLLDKEPGPAGPPLDVQIPKQESGAFPPPIPPPGAQSPVAPVHAPEKKSGASPAKPEAPVAGIEPSSKKAEQAAANAESVAKAEHAAANAEQPAKQEQASVKTAPAPKAAAVAKAGLPAAKAATSTGKVPAENAAPAGADKAVPVTVQAADDSEQERAQAALRGDVWAVSLDVFSDTKNVNQLRARLSAAGVKSYTEPVKTSKGELTRVRAGPFGSRDAAEKARAKLETMGLKPGAVASR